MSSDHFSVLDPRLIYDITAEMPEVAASLWHRFCGSLHQRMVKVSTECLAQQGSLAFYATNKLHLQGVMSARNVSSPLAVVDVSSQQWRRLAPKLSLIHLFRSISQSPGHVAIPSFRRWLTSVWAMLHLVTGPALARCF